MNAVVELDVPADQRFAPGIRADLSHPDYLRIPAFSATLAKTIVQQSPMHARFLRDHPPESTLSQNSGTAFHMGVLEPDRFETEVVAIPEDAPKRPSVSQLRAATNSPASAAAIDWWADFNARAAGKVVLTPIEAVRVDGMVRAARRHKLYPELFTRGQAEIVYQWRDARLGIACKARFDYLTHDAWASDLKSTTDASPDGFRRACERYLYHLQDAHNRTGYEHLHERGLEGLLFMAVERDPPHGVAVYAMPPNAVRFGLDAVERAMLRYAQAERDGWWPGYPEGVLPVAFSRAALSLRVTTEI